MDNYPVRNPPNPGACCGHTFDSHNVTTSKCQECLIVNPGDTHVFNSPQGAYLRQPAINATGT